jgi:hypothetical protein
MQSCRIPLGVIITLVLALIVVGNVYAKEKTKKAEFGIRAGHYGSGTLKVDSREYETESGLCYGIFFDYPVGRKFHGSLEIDLNEIIVVEKKTAVNLACLIKRDFDLRPDKVFFRPGLGFGVAFVPEAAYADKSTHLTFRTTGNIIVTDEHLGVISEVGLIWDLKGSDGENDISGGPFFYLRFGIFSR